MGASYAIGTLLRKSMPNNHCLNVLCWQLPKLVHVGLGLDLGGSDIVLRHQYPCGPMQNFYCL